MAEIAPQLTHISQFTVSGLSTRTKNEDEFTRETAKLPQLWERFYSLNLGSQKTASIFGVYSNYESDATGFYTVTAGVEAARNEDLPGLDSITVQTGPYLLFQAQGPRPEAVIKAWQQIWHYFDSQPEFRRAFASDFELYSGAECAIYIGLLDKPL